MNLFDEIIEENRKTGLGGIVSICSAHPDVIKASLLKSINDGAAVVIESTSNQVDQYGGYTGLTPDKFAKMVRNLAEEVNIDPGLIVLGGDHLGPNRWSAETESSAMSKAEVLVREYIKAGYRKIHLDASMKLSDDAARFMGNIPDEVVAERASRLCAACEDQWRKTEKGTVPPVYIVGTEVPVPGGTDSNNEELEVTSPVEAETTIRVTEQAFADRGLSEVWERVIGLVVQPGVEFGESEISDYNRQKAEGLSGIIGKYPGMVFEAHSTDYQTGNNLMNLVEDHFAILKVGPWLTFAYREALFLLSEIEKEVMAGNISDSSFLKETLLDVMKKQPGYWRKYYTGNDAEIEYKLKYSLSDRSRYYWAIKEVDISVKKLLDNLKSATLPLPLLSQYFPEEYSLIRDGLMNNSPESIILNRIMNVVRLYSAACGSRGKTIK